MGNYPMATEVSASQAKKLGCSGNLYVVEGKDFAYKYAYTMAPGRIRVHIASRGQINPVAFMEETTIPAAGLKLRPSRVK